MKIRLILLSGILFVMLTSFNKPGLNEVKNYYGIPEILKFDSVNYKLSDSYHPKSFYYKQEYIPANETPEHFNSMLTIDFSVTDESIISMVKRKELELTERKKNDPVVNFQQFENTDASEYLLDFILSDGGEKPGVVERNVYRYKTYIDKSGKKGILLFAISQRGYGVNISNFLKALKTRRINDINKVTAYNIPGIQLTE